MLGRTYQGENCSIARALECVGERWSLLIIRDALFRGMTRFSEFERSLGMAPNVLASRLERFVLDGLMEIDDGDGTGPRRYQLTAKGRDLAPTLIALTAWGDRWAAPAGAPVRYEHAGCGGTVNPLLDCTACGDHLDLSEITMHPGPGTRGAGSSKSGAQ